MDAPASTSQPMQTNSANDAKASFDSAYTQDTPHDYFKNLGELDYSICDETRPFCEAAAGLLQGWERHVRMLDIGCSYGVNAAIVKHGVLFGELARFFEASVPMDAKAGAETRSSRTVQESTDHRHGVRRAGRLSKGHRVRSTSQPARPRDRWQNLEQGADTLSPEDRTWIRGVNLIVSTGAIGYITHRTLRAVLDTMGAQASNAIALMTVLRVFDTDTVVETLRAYGLKTAFVSDALLPQRRFHADGERERIVELLRDRGLDPSPEETGRYYARVLVAARSDKLASVLESLDESRRVSSDDQARTGRHGRRPKSRCPSVSAAQRLPSATWHTRLASAAKLTTCVVLFLVALVSTCQPASNDDLHRPRTTPRQSRWNRAGAGPGWDVLWLTLPPTARACRTRTTGQT